jgi:hypothetical protein
MRSRNWQKTSHRHSTIRNRPGQTKRQLALCRGPACKWLLRRMVGGQVVTGGVPAAEIQRHGQQVTKAEKAQPLLTAGSRAKRAAGFIKTSTASHEAPLVSTSAEPATHRPRLPGGMTCFPDPGGAAKPARLRPGGARQPLRRQELCYFQGREASCSLARGRQCGDAMARQRKIRANRHRSENRAFDPLPRGGTGSLGVDGSKARRSGTLARMDRQHSRGGNRGLQPRIAQQNGFGDARRSGR